MKKTLLFLLAYLCLWHVPSSWGQTSGDPVKELRAALQSLDMSPARLPTGVLFNRTMFMTNPHRFAGQGDTAISYSGFTQQYWEFYHAAVDSTRFTTPDALQASINQRLQQDQVPLLMLQYNYNEFSATAARDHLITIDSTNERVYDGPDLTRSPYDTRHFFSVVLPAPTTRSTIAVYVGPEYWLGNTAAPSGLQIDFGDGLGARWVSMGSTVQVNVSSNPTARVTAGGKPLRVTNPNTGLVALTTLQTLTVASTPPDVALGILASRNWPGFTPTRGVFGPNGRATAIAWIKYADSNPVLPDGTRRLRRPLVFVEGIDFEGARGGNDGSGAGTYRNYSVDHTGPINLTEFTSGSIAERGGFRNGSAGWNEVVDYNKDYRSLEKFPDLRAQLQASRTQSFPDGTTGGDYDIIYLDFSDGATLIQQNAMTLVELLQWINTPANRTTTTEETMVVSVSMGGQVARFALAWMEQQNLCHNSKLYVSFDSPHRGANVPLGLQYMFDRLQNVWVRSFSALSTVQDKLLREATMQMVLFHFSPNATPFRTAWQQWQASPGSYPSLLRRVAIANGSGQSVPQAGMYDGIQLTHTVGFTTGLGAGLNYAYALPGASSRGHNNIVFRYLKPFALTNNWHYSECDSRWSHFDTAPGSSSRTVADANEQSKGALSVDWPTNTFMATTSALDIVDAGTSYTTPNLLYNVQGQIAPGSPNRAKYAFDAYFSASTVNEPHVQITNGQPTAYNYNSSFYTNNSAWIQNELRESAHNMPAVLTATYNYGSTYRHLVPSVQVNSGGQLYINNGDLPVSGGTAATQAKPAGGTFEVYTSNCLTVVQVNNGGKVYVGTTPTYAASMQISSNSLLDLWSGGQLTVAAGSVLRIVAGGTLVVRQGTTLTVAGQLIIEPGAYLCLANGQSIATTGAGQVSISSSAYRYANPIFGLTGLNCQPGTCPSTIRLTSQCKEPTAPGACSTQAVVTATGSSLGIDYRWTVDGQAYPTGNGQASISVSTSKASPTRTVSVQVSSTCPGGTPLTLTQRVGCSFPDCGPRGGSMMVAMYPNPGSNQVNFALQDEQTASSGTTAMRTTTEAETNSISASTEEYGISIYDGRGALRWQGRSKQGALHLNTSAFPRGIYGVVITQGETITRRNLSLE